MRGDGGVCAGPGLVEGRGNQHTLIVLPHTILLALIASNQPPLVIFRHVPSFIIQVKQDLNNYTKRGTATMLHQKSSALVQTKSHLFAPFLTSSCMTNERHQKIHEQLPTS